METSIVNLAIVTETWADAYSASKMSQKQWSLEAYMAALHYCEKTNLQAYLYLTDLDTDESVLIKAFV